MLMRNRHFLSLEPPTGLIGDSGNKGLSISLTDICSFSSEPP
jgi:hypothetical protein